MKAWWKTKKENAMPEQFLKDKSERGVLFRAGRKEYKRWKI